jgi:hypothetical protein
MQNPPVAIAPKFSTLRNALALLTERGDYPSAVSIGKHLGRLKDRPIGTKTLRGFEFRTGVFAWKVVSVKAKSAGDAGDAGDVP